MLTKLLDHANRSSPSIPFDRLPSCLPNPVRSDSASGVNIMAVAVPHCQLLIDSHFRYPSCACRVAPAWLCDDHYRVPMIPPLPQIDALRPIAVISYPSADMIGVG